MAVAAAWRSGCNQALMVLLMNVPTLSFGLSLGWVGLADAAEGRGAGAGGAAAAATFVAAALGVPLAGRALAAGRRTALLLVSALFFACWALQLLSRLTEGAAAIALAVTARFCAGVGGAGAWVVAPLLAKEMLIGGAAGAGACAAGAAHEAGVLVMYAAAAAGLTLRTMETWCLALSAAQCALCLVAPESPAFLAATGRHQEAVQVLQWLRGGGSGEALASEVRCLPENCDDLPTWKMFKEMVRDDRRRRALLIAMAAVVWPESCGVPALMMFAPRVLAAAGGEGLADGTAGLADGAVLAGGVSADLLWLAAAQLTAALMALWLVERVGRRPLIIWSSLATSASLALAATTAGVGAGRGAAGSLFAAAAAHAAGMHPAPYALLNDMFHYQFRACASCVCAMAVCVGEALEALVVGAMARGPPAIVIGAAAAMALAYALWAALVLPETRGRDVNRILDDIAPPKTKAATTEWTRF